MAEWGLYDWFEGGRLIGPLLLAYELLETLRVEAEDEGRDEDTEEENDASRGTPVIDVALTCEFVGFELGGTGAGLAISPARSAKVLRLSVLDGGGIAVERALVAEADISKSLPGVGI